MTIHTSFSTLDPGPVIQVSGTKPVPEIRVQKEVANQPRGHRHGGGERLAEIKAALSEHDISMKISENDETNQIVVRLVDDKTGEVIRQIPNDVSLKLAAANIKLQGSILDAEV